MAKYEITSPDGRKYEVTAPDDASQDDVLAYAQGQFQAPEQERAPRTAADIARDVGVTAVKGAVGLPQAFVGLADIPTGGRVGKALDTIGVRFDDAQKILDEQYSEQTKADKRYVHEADGFVDTVGRAIERPSTIATAVGESIPSMIGGAGIARGVLKAAPKVAPVIAGAIGEGAIGAGSAAEQIRGESKDGLLTAGQSAIAIASGIGTGILGFAGGKLAQSKLGQKLGISDVDTMLASGHGEAISKNFVRQVLASGISEGVFEELPQSAQEQMWQNYATGKPVMDGVANAAAMGMLAGAAMGGAGGGYNAAIGGRAAANQDAPAGSPPDPTAADVLGTPEPIQAAPTEAEKALYAPKSLTALDRVAEIDAQLQATDPNDITTLDALLAQRETLEEAVPAAPHQSSIPDGLSERNAELMALIEEEQADLDRRVAELPRLSDGTVKVEGGTPISSIPSHQIAQRLTAAETPETRHVIATEMQRRGLEVPVLPPLTGEAGKAVAILQKQVEVADPFTEQHADLSARLTNTVAVDAQAAIDGGEMPAYRAKNGLVVTVSPSAQNPGKLQVTRYDEGKGVIGDSQYNSVEDAIRQEGISNYERMPAGEVDAVLSNAAKAEVEYQKLRAEVDAPAGRQPEVGADNAAVQFIKRGDFWNYSGDRAQEVAKALDLPVMKVGGVSTVGIPENARKQLADTLQAAGIPASFELPESTTNVRTTPRKRPASDSLIQAIINRGGINRSIMSDVGGDKGGRYQPGLFTNNGTADLSELAQLLFDEDGFHQINQASDIGPARELAELIGQALGGERILNTDAMERDREAEMKERHKQEVIKLADEYGVSRTSNPRNIETLDRRVSEAIIAEISNAGGIAQDTRNEALAAGMTEEEVSAIEDAIADEPAFSGENLERDYMVQMWRKITKTLKERVNERKRSVAQDARGRQNQARDVAEAGNEEGREDARAEGRAADPEAGAAAERPALDLEAQSEADLAAKAAREADEGLANREIADREREAFTVAAPAGSAAPKAVPSQQGNMFNAAGEAKQAAQPKPAKVGAGGTATTEKTSAVEPQAEGKIAKHESLFAGLRDGTSTLEEFKAGFAAVVDGKDAIKAELSALTKDAIFKRFPGLAYRYKNDKKADVVDAAYRSMLDSFAYVGNDGIQWSMGEKYEDVIRGYVEKTTDESLQEFAGRVKAAKEERAEQRKAAEAGMENPVTLDDYKRILAAKAQEIGEGATFGQARMAMTPEQRARFDELTAEQSRGDRKARADQQRAEVRVAAATTEGQIVETKHTKTGEPLFVVKAAERVERDVYSQWNATAKKLGGWYSSFRGSGAVPGFQFKTRDNAEAFLKYLGGNVEQAKEAVQARRDSFEDDRSQSAAERLNEMADRLEEQAGEVLSADRKTNTARRARFAASAEASANAQKAMAQTMRNIAAAIESGQAKFLDRVRQKVQIERMQAWLASAQYDEQRAKYPTYAEQEKHRGEKPTGETADYAKFPEFTAFRSDLAQMGRRLLEIDGAKQLGTRLLKVADDVTAAYKKFAKENLHKVSTFKGANGEAAVFRTEDAAEAAIARSGFKGKATTISFKRGEHLVIMGPEMAKEAGLWQGDDDKRITLSPDFAEEIVAKAKGRDIGMPWTFETVAADRARLKAMGIETPAEFRAMLREFVAMREAPKAPDRVKELERKMIGRANDGLDFFPTPAETAQAMIDAAELKEGMSVLEPSAGWGHIAEKIRDAGVEPDVVELSGDRRELLEAKGFNLVSNDFMDVAGEYDRIIMNPPFGDRRDAEHVQHAYSLLKPGGRLVAIMGEGVFYGQDKKAQAFREWLESVGGTSEKLEEGTFLDSSLPVNTGVNARLVVVDRKQTDSGVAMFNAKSGARGNPIDAAALEATIGRVIAGSPSHFSRDTVVTAPLFAALPAPILAKAKKEGYDSHGRKPNGEKLTGATYDGKVYLVQENISSELEAEETLLHERIHQIVHGNAKDPDGVALRQSLGKLYTRLGAKSGIERMAKEAGIDIAGPLAAFPKVTAANRHAFLAEEFLAHAEGQRAYEKLPAKIKRAAREFWGEFRDWLRASKFVRIAEALGAKLDDFTQSDLAWTLKGIRQQEAGAGSKAIRFMTAWHGSPHDHDGFDSSKIGTGEGAQAYGWGHYFAGAREVAEWYRDKLTSSGYSLRGKKGYEHSTEEINAVIKIGRMLAQGSTESMAINLVKAEARRDVDNAKKLLDEQTQNLGKEVDSGAGWGDLRYQTITQADVDAAADGYEAAKRRLEVIEDIKPGDVAQNKGRLYQVELAPEHDEYLDWDKPLSEQSEKVREALQGAANSFNGRTFNGRPANDGTDAFLFADALHDDHRVDGGVFYKSLTRKLASDKAASEYLHSIGIRGIRYLNGSSRNRPLKDIKAEFLAELPEDADTAEVMELVGTGRFSPKNEALIKALAADDWLGFDYPAQAISAALGNGLSNYDASPALLQAVSDAKDGGTYNYVIFDDADVKITAKLSRGAGRGMSLRDLQAVVDRLAPGFKNLPRVHAMESPADLSTKDPSQKALRDYIKSRDAMNDADGAMHDGEIYLFASGMAGELRAEHVLATHEITHYGLRGAVGKELDAALQHVWLHNGKVRKAAQAVRDADETIKSNVEAIEEVLADMPSAELAKLTGWRAVVKRVRNWLKKIGAVKLAAKLDAWINAGLSEQQQADLFVAEMVTAAREWVRTGKGKADMSGTRLADPTLADDMARQEKWLAKEAKARGYQSIDELAEKAYPVFENLAALWRKKNPVEVAMLSRSGYAFDDGILDYATADQVIDGARLKELRRSAARLEKPRTGTSLQVTEDGRAIATGEKGTRIPETFIRFAQQNGLRFEARRIVPQYGNIPPANMNIGITKKSEPMPIEYRESGALYFGEGGASVDRTGKTRFSRAASPAPTSAPAHPPAPGNPWQAAKAKAAAILTPERIDRAIYEFQDKMIDLKRLRDHIKDIGGVINDLNDAYMGEELYHKRVAKRTEDFLAKEVKPLLADMRFRAISIEEMETYLHARHAPEANAEMAKRNPNQAEIDAGRKLAADEVKALELQLQAAQSNGGATKSIEQALNEARGKLSEWNGAQAFRGTEAERLSLSGMSDADAAKIMAGLAPGKRVHLTALSAKVDAMNAKTLDELEKYGLMDKASLDAWRNAYQHYVPLHRDEAHPDSASHPIGQGYSTKGDASKQRTGSNAKVTHILGHIAMQREAALTRGEKNHVMRRLYLMAKQNPLKDVWSIDKIPTIETIDKKTGFVKAIPDPLHKMRPNVLMLRIAGKDVAITMNENNPEAVRMAAALKNLDVDDLHYIIPTVAKATRWFASVNTQYNPIFGIVNFTRDIQAAMLQLSTTEIAGRQGEVFKDTMAIMKQVLKSGGRMPKAGQWGALFDEMQNVGGTTGYRDLFLNAEDRANSLLKELKSLERGKVSQAAHAVVEWLSDYNEAMENAVRLAAYKAAIDNGMTKERAASLAKNLTVNFNRKGRQTREIGALYAFFNAAVQGTTRMAQTLAGPAGKKIMAGGVAVGALSALMGMAMMGDGDDDEYAKIPEFIKERALIFPVSKDSYIAIPMPLGFHFLPNIGRLAVEMFAYKDKTIGKQVVSMFSVMAEAFNPLGGSAPALQMAMPTVLDPFVALAENKDWTGKAIYLENYNNLDPEPGHRRTKDSATAWSKAFSEAINAITGGTQYTPGAWSPTPDQIDYVIGQLTGGVGREIGKLATSVQAPFTGDELPPHKLPLVGRFYGNTSGPSGQSEKFYENIKLANQHENEIVGRLKDGKPTDDYLKENPSARELAARGNVAEAQVRKLRSFRKEIARRDEPDAKNRKEEINHRIAAIMKGLNHEAERLR